MPQTFGNRSLPVGGSVGAGFSVVVGAGFSVVVGVGGSVVVVVVVVSVTTTGSVTGSGVVVGAVVVGGLVGVLAVVVSSSSGQQMIGVDFSKRQMLFLRLLITAALGEFCSCSNKSLHRVSAMQLPRAPAGVLQSDNGLGVDSCPKKIIP